MIMKNIILLFLMLFSMIKANAMQNVIVAQHNKLVLCDINNQTQRDIITIDDIELWDLGNCQYIDGQYKIFLYKRSDYMNFSKFGVLSEIIVYYNEKSSILINDTIQLMNNNFYRCTKNNLDLLSIKSVKELYRNKSSISDESGTISVFDTTTEEKTPILESWNEKGTQIGFFNAMLSFDGKKIICEKIIGKHDWKKRIAGPVIVEYDIENQHFNEIRLKGCCPLYSDKDNYILYRAGTCCYIYDITSKKNIFSCEAQQAIWVD